jgi:hypothetical protein
MAQTTVNGISVRYRLGLFDTCPCEVPTPRMTDGGQVSNKPKRLPHVT